MGKFLFLTDEQKIAVARANQTTPTQLQGGSLDLNETNTGPRLKITGLTEEDKQRRADILQRLRETKNPKFDNDKLQFLKGLDADKPDTISLDPAQRSEYFKNQPDNLIPGVSVEQAAEDKYVKSFFELDSKTMEGHFSMLSRKADSGDKEALKKMQLIRRAAPGLQEVLLRDPNDVPDTRSNLTKTTDYLFGGAKRSFAGVRNFVGVDLNIGPLDIEIVQSRAEQILEMFDAGEINESQFKDMMQEISQEAGLNWEDDAGTAARKTFANFGEAAFDIATLGTSSSAAKTAAKTVTKEVFEQGAKATSKEALKALIKQSAKSAGRGALEGAGGGLIQSFQGENAPTVEDALINTAFGAAFGGALGGAGPVVGDAASRATSKAKKTLLKPVFAWYEYVDVPQLRSSAARKQIKELGKDADEVFNTLIDDRVTKITGESAETRLATQTSNESQKQLRKDILELGGISESAVEDLPKWAKRKKGQSADRVVQELNSVKGYNIKDEDELVSMLLKQDQEVAGKVSKKNARQQAIQELLEGNSEEADVFRMTLNSLQEITTDIAERDARGEILDAQPKLTDALPAGSETLATENISEGNVKPRVNRATDARQDGTQTRQVGDKQRLKDRLRDEARGSREGFSEGRRTMKEELMQKVVEKRENVKQLKGELVRYIQENVDLDRRGKLLARVKNAKTRLDLEKAMKYADDVQADANRKKLQAGLNKKFKRFNTKNVKGLETGKLTADAQKAITQARDISKMSKEAARSEIEQLIDEYAGQTLPLEVKQRINLLDTFADTKNMNQIELAKAADSLDQLIKTGRTARLAKDEARQLRINKAKEDAARVISGGKEIDETGQIVKKDTGIAGTLRKLDNWQQGWDTMMDKLSRYDKGSRSFQSDLNKFADVVHDARNKQTQGTRQLFSTIQDSYANIFGTSSKRQLKRILQENTAENEISLRVADDKSVTRAISKNQAYKKYMEWQDPNLRPRFEAMGWTQDTIDDLVDYMGPQLKEWADYQLDVFYPQYYQTINEVYREKFGVDLPFNSRYSPIVADFGAIDNSATLLQKEVKAYSSTRPGSLKKRTSKGPLPFNDGDQVLIRHINQMEHFKAWENTLGDVRSVFMDPKVRAGIRQFHGDDALKTVDKMINDMAADGASQAATLNIVDKMRSNFTKAVLGINPGVFLKQLSSIPAFMSEIPAKEWAVGQADFWTNPIGKSKKLMESEVLQARYDVGFTRDMITAMGRDSVNKLANTDSFLNRLMFTTKAGDKGAILAGGWSVYKYHLKEALAEGLDKVDAEKRAMSRFERALNRTQQAGTPEALGQLQRTGSFGKLFTMFQTSPNQYYRIASRSLRNIKEGRGNMAENYKNLFVSWIVLPATFQWVADGFEFNKDTQTRAALLGPANGILAVGQVLDPLVRTLTGDDLYENQSIPGPIQTGEDAYKTLEKIVKTVNQDDITASDVMDVLDDIADTAGKVTGVPTVSATRSIEGAASVIEGEGKSGIQTFEVKSDAANLLKGVLYGKYGTSEGSQFADENFGKQKKSKDNKPSSRRSSSSTRKDKSIRRSR